MPISQTASSESTEQCVNVSYAPRFLTLLRHFLRAVASTKKVPLIFLFVLIHLLPITRDVSVLDT